MTIITEIAIRKYVTVKKMVKDTNQLKVWQKPEGPELEPGQKVKGKYLDVKV